MSQGVASHKNAIGWGLSLAREGIQKTDLLENAIENFIFIIVPVFFIILWSVVTNIRDDRHGTLGKVTSTCTWESLQHKHRKSGPQGPLEREASECFAKAYKLGLNFSWLSNIFEPSHEETWTVGQVGGMRRYFNSRLATWSKTMKTGQPRKYKFMGNPPKQIFLVSALLE